MPETLALDMHIVVRQFGTGSQYRAAVEIAGKAFIGAGRQSPIEAVQILLQQISGASGSWGDDAMMALDIALAGFDDIKGLLAEGRHTDD